MKLLELRSELCRGVDHHCRRCFEGRPTAPLQCPPNVFRVGDGQKLVTFVFDKPNDNTNYRTSPLIPIAAFDDRAGIDIRLARAPSHNKLVVLCRLLGLIEPESLELASPLVHITNAAKCDVSADKGLTGRIAVPAWQARTCVGTFLTRELEAVRSRAIVFFGRNAQTYVLDEVTPLWEICARTVGERLYSVMRVSHTSPEAFNTHGKKGAAYVEPFKKLLAAAQRVAA